MLLVSPEVGGGSAGGWMECHKGGSPGLTSTKEVRHGGCSGGCGGWIKEVGRWSLGLGLGFGGDLGGLVRI